MIVFEQLAIRVVLADLQQCKRHFPNAVIALDLAHQSELRLDGSCVGHPNNTNRTRVSQWADRVGECGQKWEGEASAEVLAVREQSRHFDHRKGVIGGDAQCRPNAVPLVVDVERLSLDVGRLFDRQALAQIGIEVFLVHVKDFKVQVVPLAPLSVYRMDLVQNGRVEQDVAEPVLGDRPVNHQPPKRLGQLFGNRLPKPRCRLAVYKRCGKLLEQALKF